MLGYVATWCKDRGGERHVPLPAGGISFCFVPGLAVPASNMQSRVGRGGLLLRQKPQAGCWFYASAGVRLSPRLFIQPRVVQDTCFLQVFTTSCQRMTSGQSRCCGRCLQPHCCCYSALKGGGMVLFCEDSEWKMWSYEHVNKDSEEKKHKRALTCHLRTPRGPSPLKIFVQTAFWEQ